MYVIESRQKKISFLMFNMALVDMEHYVKSEKKWHRSLFPFSISEGCSFQCKVVCLFY